MKPLKPEAQIIALKPVSLKPPRDKRAPAFLGLGAIAIAVGGLGIWGTTAPIASAVIVQGDIVVSSKRKEIQHLYGGTVGKILARDGDIVKAGDILIELDARKADSRYALARSSYFSMLATRARIKAERDDLEKIDFPEELLVARTSDPDLAVLIESHSRVFETKRHEFEGQHKLMLQRRAQLDDEISGLTAEKIAVEAQTNLAVSELVVLEKLYNQGYTTRARLLTFRREKAQLAGSLGKINGQIARANKQIGSIEMRILQQEKERDKEIAAELRETEQRLYDAKEGFISAEAEQASLKVRAPVNGAVVSSRVHTIGGVIRSGDTLMEIVPKDDKLIVEVHVRPVDIDDISIGQETEVRLSAFKQRDMPSLYGKVFYISADRAIDKQTGEAHYIVHVAIAPESLKQLGQTHRLVPGMPAEAMIQTGERTAMAYLLEPIADSVNRAWREN